MQQLVMLDVQSHPRTKEPISERSKISLTKQRNIFEELNIYSLLLKDKQLRKKIYTCILQEYSDWQK